MSTTAFMVFMAYWLGLLTGAIGVLAYGLYRLRKLDQERLKFAQSIAKEAQEIATKATSAKERINKAFDICERQFEILSGMEGPQSGPLHGKHKQKMNAELKRLEEEKMTLLKSVLADGYDPKLVVINDAGEKEAVRLSEFIKRRDLNEESAGKPTVPYKPERKLTLIKNEEEK